MADERKVKVVIQNLKLAADGMSALDSRVAGTALDLIAGQQAEIARLTAELEKVNARNEWLENRSTEQDSVVAELKASAKTAAKELSKAETANSNLLAKQTKLNTKNDTLKNEINNLKVEKKELQAKYNQLHLDNVHATAQVEKLNGQIKSLTAQHEKLEQQYMETVEKLQSMKDDLTKARSKYDSLFAEKERAIGERDANRARLLTLEQACSEVFVWKETVDGKLAVRHVRPTDDTKKTLKFTSPDHYASYEDSGDFGKTYRFWSLKPTEEQRQEPWSK